MILQKVLFFILISLASQVVRANDLKPFETDGCTMFSEGTAEQPKLWEHCCTEHDLRYWFGGTSVNTDFADLELRACVKQVAGESWARLIYNGVRAGHSSPIKSKYSWSWGWSQDRGSGALSDAEITYIQQELYSLPMDRKFIEDFIRKYLGTVDPERQCVQ